MSQKASFISKAPVLWATGLYNGDPHRPRARLRSDCKRLSSPSTAYLGLPAALGSDGSYVLASAFRTRAGAEEFAALAASAGVPARIVGPVISLGGPYAGLGQEADPSGQGPLLHALSPEEQAALQ